MAGGRGTRISAIAQDIPKPMIPICGVPVLEREIVCLRNQGFTDIILTVSHMGEVIMDYFKDGSQLGVHISYSFLLINISTWYNNSITFVSINHLSINAY